MKNNGAIIQENLERAVRLFSQPSTQGMLHVFQLDDPPLRFLYIGKQLASALLLNPLEPGFPHLKKMANLCKKVQKNGSVITLGHGAGVLSLFALLEPTQLKVTSVDVDAAFFSIAENYFFLKPTKRLHLVKSEARTFLEKLKTPCDLLLIDVFIEAEAVPREFKTEETVRLYYRALKKGGVACMNYVGHQTKRKEFNAIRSAFKTVFGNCRVVFTEEHSSKLHQNILFIGKK